MVQARKGCTLAIGYSFTHSIKKAVIFHFSFNMSQHSLYLIFQISPIYEQDAPEILN